MPLKLENCVTLNHGGHDLRLIEEEAENKTLEIKSILQTQREGLDAKLNVIAQLDEDCAKVIQQSEIARRDVQRFADGLIKTIQAKMQNIITAVENQTKKSLESLKAKRSAIQQQINATESSLEEADKLLLKTKHQCGNCSTQKITTNNFSGIESNGAHCS